MWVAFSILKNLSVTSWVHLLENSFWWKRQNFQMVYEKRFFQVPVEAAFPVLKSILYHIETSSMPLS